MRILILFFSRKAIYVQHLHERIEMHSTCVRMTESDTINRAKICCFFHQANGCWAGFSRSLVIIKIPNDVGHDKIIHSSCWISRNLRICMRRSVECDIITKYFWPKIFGWKERGGLKKNQEPRFICHRRSSSNQIFSFYTKSIFAQTDTLHSFSIRLTENH